MKDLTTYRTVYFIGIGGIGMSALARYFMSKGLAVAGYDKTSSTITEELVAEGADISFEDKVKTIPEAFRKKEKEASLVIYTPAIPVDSHILDYFEKGNTELIKRSEALSRLTLGKKTIAVAGTHGKTSTVALISHILKTANVSFTAFIGGISANYKTNYISTGDDANIMVVEADEFDRSFLRLNPDTAVVTAVESDHLDIYGTVEELKKAYSEFTYKVKHGGKLILQKKVGLQTPAHISTSTYSAKEKADYFADNIRVVDGTYLFDYVSDSLTLKDLKIGVPGRHNIENAVAAIAATLPYISNPTVYYKALETFKGVHRRFEVIYKDAGLLYVDDYAHHPTEISITLETLRELKPNAKILAVFQPHLYSRTRDLAEGFAESLSLANEIFLLPIYPAREQPIEGVSSEMILEKIKNKPRRLIEKPWLAEEVAASNAEVIITIGAGDIDRLVEPIKEQLAARRRKG